MVNHAAANLYQPQQTRALADLIHRFACKAFFLRLPGAPHIIDRGQIIQNAVPLEPAVPAADSIIRCGIGLDGIGAVQHLQPGLQLLQHLAQLLLRIPKNIRQRKSLRLRRPCIEHPGNEISQFFCTERKQRLRGLFIHLNCTGRYLLEQPCKLLRTASRDGIQIGQAEHLDLKFAGFSVMEAKFLCRICQQRFAGGRRQCCLRP